MMLTRTVLPMMVCFSPAFLAVAAADERQDAAHMEQLLADVQKFVPPGWDVTYDLIHPGFPDIPGPYPTLVIKSDKPLPLEFVNLPGMPGGAPDDPPDILQTVVTIHFFASPYLSEKDYATARERNDALHQKRIQFEREHLQKIPWSGHKEGEPIPPEAYEPRTEKETQLVRQYAFLWISTEPRPLPTHHTDHLAFEMRYIPLDIVKIHDDKRSKEYEQIVGALKKIIVPYETDP